MCAVTECGNHVITSFDAHDRVNYAVLSANLTVNREKKTIQMEMELDDTMCTVIDYFEIFLETHAHVPQSGGGIGM